MYQYRPLGRLAEQLIAAPAAPEELKALPEFDELEVLDELLGRADAVELLDDLAALRFVNSSF